MLQRFLNSFKTDCRYIVRDPVLMAAALYPLIVILLLRLAINPVSDLIFLKTGFRLEIYYTIIAITLISVIPLLVGFIYAVTDIDKTVSNKDNSLSLTPADKKSFLFFRMMEPALFSFIMILIVTLLLILSRRKGGSDRFLFRFFFQYNHLSFYCLSGVSPAAG
jgi:hypothetical protein